MKTHFATLLRRATTTLALALTLGAAGTAHATYVVGNWDPAYGAPFSNLGWRGTTTTYFDDTCLALAPGFLTIGTCPSMSLISATVEFYALVPYSATPATVETLVFTGLTSVTGIQLDANGDVDGINLTLSSPVASTSSLAVYGFSNASFQLEMVYSPTNNETDARLHWSGTDANERPVGGVNSNRAEVNFTTLRVPEPGSLVLTGAALALAGLARRRSLR